MDVVEGAKGCGYLLTLVERTTAFTLIGALQQATASRIATLAEQLLIPIHYCPNKKMAHGIKIVRLGSA